FFGVMPRRHTIVPLSRSRQIVSSFLAFESYPVKKIRSAQIHGEEWPGGRGVCQATFLSGPNCVGSGLASGAVAEPPGPRNCGQYSCGAGFSCAPAAHVTKIPDRNAPNSAGRRIVRSLKTLGKFPPSGYYTDGRCRAIAVTTDAQFQALRRTTGIAALTHGRLRLSLARMPNECGGR